MQKGSGKMYLMKILPALAMLILMPGKGSACHDYPTVERLTSRYFTEQKWDSVVITGNEAIEEEIDYYYLRLRMGISYYHLGKNHSAAEHLEKAVAFNSSDPVAFDYLTRIYLLLNRPDEARYSASRIQDHPQGQKKLKLTYPVSIYAEGGYIMSSDDGRMPVADLMMSDSIYGEEDLYGDSYYAYLGLKENLTPSLSVSVGYTYMDFSKTKNMQYGYFTDVLDSTVNTEWGYLNYYSFPKEIERKSFNYHVKQNEIHLGVKWVIRDGITLQPFLHLINDHYSAPSTRIEVQPVTDTAWFVRYDSSYTTFTFNRIRYHFPEQDTSFWNYSAGIMLSKYFRWYNAGFSLGFSQLNDRKQFMGCFSLDYFPLNNVSFYGNTTITGFSEGSDSRAILQQTLGGNPWKQLWIEGNFILGDITNASLNNGTLVYNNTGRVKYLAGAEVSWYFSEQFSARIGYRYSERESLQTFYETNNPGESPPLILKTKYNPYTTNTLTAGIQWKPKPRK